MRRFFTTFQLANYHPLALLVLAVEHRLFGLEPSAYHAVSLLLHVGNTLLAFGLARALGAPAAAAGVCGLLFGLHPLHVEPVAWVAEQKELLCTFFSFAALALYARSPHGAGRALRLAGVFGLALLALLSKPMAVTLPIVLLLVDRYRGRPLAGAALLEKIPFALLSGAFALLTLAAQRDAIRLGPSHPLWQGIFIASHGVLFYLGKALLPLRLSALYPLPGSGGGPLPPAFLLAPAGLLLLAGALTRLAGRSPAVAFGALFTLTTLLPVLQLVPVGLAHAADRYFYLPSFGVFFLAGLGWTHATGAVSGSRGRLLRTAGVAALAALGALTWQRLGVWRDGVTLWSDVLERHPRSAVSYGNRGHARAASGDAAGALADFQAALDLGLAPALRARVLFDRARLRQDLGELEAAVAEYGEALRLDPRHVEALVNRGNALDAAGRPADALADYDEALRRDSGSDLAYYNRGLTRRRLGDLPGALSDFDAALRLNPWRPAAWFNRAVVLAAIGRLAEAREDLDRAVALRPDDGETLRLRGAVRGRLGDARGAEEDLRRAAAPAAK